MSATDILGLLRLKSAPWLTLLISVVSLFALWAIFHDVTVSSAVSNFLLALELPSSVDRGAMNAHKWLVAEPRVTWASWGAVILAVAAGARYVRAVYNLRESSSERIRAGREVGRAKRRPVNEGIRYETDEIHAQRLELAQADYSKAAKYDRELQAFEQRSQLRCAALYWLTAAVLVELQNEALPGQTVEGTGAPLVTLLIAIGVVTLIAIFIACAMQEFYDAFEDPTTADRFKDTFRNFVWEVVFLVFRLALILLALPLFVLGIFLYSPSPVKSDGEAAGS
jgi:hypothetical protein